MSLNHSFLDSDNIIIIYFVRFSDITYYISGECSRIINYTSSNLSGFPASIISLIIIKANKEC